VGAARLHLQLRGLHLLVHHRLRLQRVALLVPQPEVLEEPGEARRLRAGRDPHQSTISTLQLGWRHLLH
jgi:hypothetical protein